MKTLTRTTRALALLLAVVMVLSVLPVTAFARSADATLTASLAEAKGYIDSITINNSSNDPEKVVKTFKTHFTWDNEKRENSKSYLFDWSYYNGVVFEGIEYVYEATGEKVYRDYVIEYMSSLIASNGTWAKCTNSGYTSKQCAGYDATHGADCYMTAALLLDCYEMTGDSRYLTIANTLYADLDNAAKSYSLSKAGNNFRHTWSTDPSPDLWLDGLYMILPFRAEYAKYIGDTEELDLIVSRMQWVSDNMYNSSKKLFYHAADSASSNSGTYWLRSIGWYAAAIVDIMDHMEGQNLETMKKQLVKLVDGMKACQNSSNGMWLNNMNASQSSSNPYETSGTALTCYAVMKAVNKGWLDESYADMAILAFNGICREKLSNNNLTDICFKGAPGSSNSTFYDNEGKGLGPFIMFYAEMLKYVNAEEIPEETVPETTVPETTVPEETEPAVTEPAPTEPAPTEPTEPEATAPVYEGTGVLESGGVYKLDSDGINSGTKYIIVYSGKALKNNNGVDANPAVTISNNTITLADDSNLAWTITQSGSNYTVENNGSYLNLNSSGDDPIGSSATVSISRSGSTYIFRKSSSSGAYLRYSSSQFWCTGTNNSNNKVSLYGRTSGSSGDAVTFTVTGLANAMKLGGTAALNAAVTVKGAAVALNKCTVTWSSSNAACVSVSGGTVTAKASGDAVITATLTAVNGTALKNAITLTIPVSVQGHSYKAVVTKPTCTEAGFTTYTCTICGDSYVTDRTAALGHSYSSATTEPTCTADGAIVYTCHCGHSYSEAIPATGHSHKAVVTKPTCTTRGFTTYTCACGDSYVSDYTAALGHSYSSATTKPTCTADGAIVYTCHCGHSYSEAIPATGHSHKAVITKPTCTTRGFTTYTCACGDVYVSDYTAALGHDAQTVTTEPTCTEGGSTVSTCERCGHVEILAVTEALGHDYAAVVTKPTCETAGFTTYTCDRCGDAYVSDHTAALGHDLETVTVDATCEADGSVTTTCVRCGEKTVEILPALGHELKTVTVEPTCTADGSVTGTCVRCGKTETEVLPATGHSHQAVVTKPTCTEGGFTTYTCHCGDSYVSDETAALGHELKSVTVAATCEADGSVTTACVRCDWKTVEVIPATGHAYEAVITAPTCENGGFTTHTCANCGGSYVSDETAALGHDYASVVTEPTCETIGFTTHTCDRCDDTYVSDRLPALGHDLETVTVAAACETDGSVTTTCVRCGETEVEVLPALGHDLSTVTVDATCTENGSETTTCARCDYETVEVIPAAGHSHEAVVTKPTCVNGGFTTCTCHCGDTYVSDETAALGHALKSVTVDATCTANGSVTTTCARCDYKTVEVIPAAGHSHKAVVTAPTCETAGFTTYTCHCGDRYVSDETAALGHDRKTVTVDATCEANGSVTTTCARCGEKSVEILPALGHNYVCTEQSDCLVYTCEHCGDTYTESIGWTEMGKVYVLDTNGIDVGKDHKYLIVGANSNYALTLKNGTISATAVTIRNNTITLDNDSANAFWFTSNSSERNTYLLTQDGSKSVYHVGGEIKYGHDSKGYWYFGSKSNGSYQLYDYDNQNWYLNYGYVWASDSVNRFAVSSNARTVRLFQATQSYARLTGSMRLTCTDADGMTEAAILSGLAIQTSTNGTDVASTQAVTADQLTWNVPFDGTTAGVYTATVSYQGVALGTVTVTVTSKHTYEIVTVAPTCTEGGCTYRACTTCGVRNELSRTEALGHSYSETKADGLLIHTCTRCGDSYSEALTTYTKASSLSSGKRYVITLTSGGKTYALSHSGNSLSLVQVTVSNNKITSEIGEDLLWSYSSNKLRYTSGSKTYSLYASSNNNWWGNWFGSSASLSLSTSNSSTVSFSGTSLKIGSYYLTYSSGSAALSSSAGTVNCYVEN